MSIRERDSLAQHNMEAKAPEHEEAWGYSEASCQDAYKSWVNDENDRKHKRLVFTPLL